MGRLEARRLIVNADDFGRSRSINSAVIRAHREGILTTASLMVNEEASDEAVALASGFWEAGGSAELHIWAGGFHGFQTIVPTAAVSQTAVQTRESWVRRVLAP